MVRYTLNTLYVRRRALILEPLYEVGACVLPRGRHFLTAKLSTQGCRIHVSEKFHDKIGSCIRPFLLLKN